MSEVVVAKRYAEALFQIGKEKGTLEQLQEEFLTVREVFETNKELQYFLTHPKVNVASRKDFVAQVFGKLQADVVNAIKLLVDRNRVNIIPTVATELIKLVQEENGIAEATVYSVRSLSDDEKQKLEQSFKKRLNKNKIHFNNIVDPSVIGGVKIRVGNTIYDGSISGRLHRIKQQIVSANN